MSRGASFLVPDSIEPCCCPSCIALDPGRAARKVRNQIATEKWLRRNERTDEERKAIYARAVERRKAARP
jgi:uncharacterized alpha-E superfamily protein